jgi:hypothetical protein
LSHMHDRMTFVVPLHLIGIFAFYLQNFIQPVPEHPMSLFLGSSLQYNLWANLHGAIAF